MRRVLVVTWALGTATGVLLGLFGVQLVSSRFSTAGVSPMSRPEVLRALQAARSVPAADEVAAPAAPNPDTADPPPSPPVDAAPARPSAGSTSSPASAPPASALPRPGVTAGTIDAAVAAAAAASTTTPAVSDPGPTSTTATTEKASTPKSDSKGSTTSTTRKSTTTTTSKTTTTTTQAPSKPSGSQSAETKTISSAGGVVAVRFSNGKVELKWARPNPGYQVYVKSNGPDSVVVYFYTKKNRVSEVRAFYKGNTPASEVREYTGANPQSQQQNR